jgi:phage-related minor tail protein
MKTPLDLITEGFNGFFDNLARGTADASELFKRMVQSILANVAKLALNKLFVNLFGSAFGLKLGGNGMSIVPSAKGNAFGGATGLPWGVYSQPTFFPMPGNGPLRKFATGGVLAEAGYPEAILPLRRGAGGRLGVEAQAPVVNVNVVNNAGAQVRTEQNGNDITIYIEQIKQAIARDIRAGAGVVTSAMQGTYGLNRAAGAR